MNELQQVQYEMLKRFVWVCEELNLNYYVLGGTLLGAVRHQGFIPWDDDIDIGMLRSDYEVFLEKGQELLGEPYFLQTFETDPEYPNNFAKIRNSNTTFIETSARNCRMNHGVYIDVFPLDYYPAKGVREKIFNIKNYLLAGRISCVYYSPMPLRLKSRIKRAVCRLIHPSLDKAIRTRNRLFVEMTESTKIANHCGAWGKREIMPAEWFGDGAELTFEGIKVTGPKEYDKYLKQLYDDYMKLPPVEKRQGHHYADVIDLEKAYIHYR